MNRARVLSRRQPGPSRAQISLAWARVKRAKATLRQIRTAHFSGPRRGARPPWRFT